MISLHEYSMSPLARKADYLYDHGIFIAHRASRNYLTELYALDNFFVEIQLSNDDTCNDHIVIKIQALNSLERLEPYLRKISISDLYQF